MVDFFGVLRDCGLYAVGLLLGRFLGDPRSILTLIRIPVLLVRGIWAICCRLLSWLCLLSTPGLIWFDCYPSRGIFCSQNPILLVT